MRKHLIVSGLALGAMLEIAAPAMAQQTPPTTPPTNPTQGTLQRDARLATTWRVPHGIRSEYEMFLDEATGNNVSASLERIDLANRVSGLIELGKCADARALANAEGDRQMALRARQICRASRD